MSIHKICCTFRQYIRLAVVHLGLQDWQLWYTDDDPIPSSQVMFTFSHHFFSNYVLYTHLNVCFWMHVNLTNNFQRTYKTGFLFPLTPGNYWTLNFLGKVTCNISISLVRTNFVYTFSVFIVLYRKHCIASSLYGAKSHI